MMHRHEIDGVTTECALKGDFGVLFQHAPQNPLTIAIQGADDIVLLIRVQERRKITDWKPCPAPESLGREDNPVVVRHAHRARIRYVHATFAQGCRTMCFETKKKILFAGYNRERWLQTARWEALDNLVSEERVRPDDIDGGFEFNAWYLCDPNYRPSPEKSWCWVTNDDFMIAFGPVPGYKEMKRYHFQRWLPPGEGTILILRKNDAKLR